MNNTDVQNLAREVAKTIVDEIGIDECYHSGTDGAVVFATAKIQTAIDKVAEPLRERIAELLRAGGMVEQYGSACWNDGYNAATGERRTRAAGLELEKIKQLLRGVASDDGHGGAVDEIGG